jgi:hypothetical protein
MILKHGAMRVAPDRERRTARRIEIVTGRVTQTCRHFLNAQNVAVMRVYVRCRSRCTPRQDVIAIAQFINRKLYIQLSNRTSSIAGAKSQTKRRYPLTFQREPQWHPFLTPKVHCVRSCRDRIPKIYEAQRYIESG